MTDLLPDRRAPEDRIPAGQRRCGVPGPARSWSGCSRGWQQAMQLHGGNGYTTERRVERYWRGARLTTIFEGTSEIQRRIISDRLLPRARRGA